MYQLKYVPISQSPLVPIRHYVGHHEYLLLLITTDGIANLCFARNAHDSEAEAWLIHSCGLEGSQVEIINPIDLYSGL